MQQKTAQKLMAENLRIYNEVARNFARTRENKLQELEPLAQLTKDGNRLLDVGSGSGRLFELFKNREIEYFGIDTSEEMIKLCKEKFAAYPSAHFTVASALKINFPNESFDAIYAIAALHHIPSPELQLQALQEFYRLLKPGGKLIMTNWYWWRGWAILIILKYWFKKLCATAVIATIFLYSNVLKNIRITNRGELDLQHSHILENMRMFADLSFGDIFVPWGKAGLRYYHSFRQHELKKLLVEAGFIKITQHLTRKRGDHWGKRVNLVTIAEK